MKIKARPPFVKHIIILMILFGVTFIGFNALIAVMLIVHYGSNPLIVVVSAPFIALFAAIFVCAYGLWTMKSWSRKATIGTLIAIIVSGLPGILALLVFFRAIRNLLKSETKVAFGEKLSEGEMKELQYKTRKAKRICEGCGAKDMLLHKLEKDEGFKLVCYECLKKAQK